MTELLQVLTELGWNLVKLVVILASLMWRYSLVLGWLAWWMLLVDWRQFWPALRQGAWLPLFLALGLVSYLIWLLGVPVPGTEELGALTPVVASLALLGSALFCGWLQTVFAWYPVDISLEPVPAHHGAEHDDHVHGNRHA